MKKLLLTIWQLPQHIVGQILKLFYPPILDTEFRGVKVRYSEKMYGDISLGDIIILSASAYVSNLDEDDNVKHEWGHTRQSLMLGPLYLLIVGIPSIIWAGLYGSLIEPTKNGYYKFYTESWADKLGGVKR